MARGNDMRRFTKILFSRLGITAVLVLFELALVLTIMLRLSAYSVYFFILLILNHVASLIAVVNGEGNPEYKLTWMGVIVLIPFLGTALYAMFGKSKMSKREIRRLVGVRAKMKECTSPSDALDSLGKEDRLASGKAMAILNIDKSSGVYSRTVSKYYGEGKQMFTDMLADIESAEEYIFLEYFIIERGVMWDGIYSRLREKAQAGVDVRVMYDDVGCMSTLPKRFRDELEMAGIQCLCFSRVSADLRNMRRNNNRDHRKLCIIDGRVAYTGGVNIADEYIGEREKYGVWKDGGVRLSGDGALGFARLFLELWLLSGGSDVNTEEYLKSDYTLSGDGGYYLPFGSGPYPMYTSQSGKRAILDIVNQAERYVYLMTPYLIIDYDLSEALLGAAYRGVDVRIITPGIPDKKMVNVMTKSSYSYLINGGVAIYEYTPGFLHAKAIVSDDEYAVLGTINLDYRSLVHHFEDAVWMYCSPAIRDVREDCLETMQKSERIGRKNAKLGLKERIVRCGIRLFAPLL